MKKLLSLSLSALLLVSLCIVPAFAANKTMTAIEGTPSIDGKAEALWNDAPSYVPDVVLVDNGGTARASFQMLWDADHLYVFTTVTGNSEPFTGNGDAWLNDCIEFFISEENAKSTSYQAGDKQIRVNAANVVTEDDGRGIVSAVESTADGYNVEIAIPFVVIKGEAGKVIGFDGQIANSGGAGQQNTYLATLADDVTGGMQYNNASGFGDLTLEGSANSADEKTDDTDDSAGNVTDDGVKGNKETNPQTGDNGLVFFAAIALLASAAFFSLTFKKARAQG